MPLEILLAEDEPTLLEILGDELAESGHRVTRCAEGNAAAARLCAGSWDLLVSDIRLPGRDGYALAELALSRDPPVEVILMTAYGEVDRAVDMLKRGVRDYLTKPFNEQLLTERVATLERQLGDRGGNGYGLIARSETMSRLMRVAERVARCDETVLLTGECGLTRHTVARALHDASDREEGPFIDVNCAAASAEAIEDEVFESQGEGALGAARGGTLYLDEVAALSVSAQSRLLGLIEASSTITRERTGTRPARVMAATSRDLEEAVREGSFREELLFALTTFHLEVPPLRERVEDLLPLALRVLDDIRPRLLDAPQKLEDDALAALLTYPWPGNLREFRTAIAHAAVLSTNGTLRRAHLPARVRGDETSPSLVLKDALGRVEAQQIRRALAVTAGSRTRSASLLGISRKHLWELMKRHGIEG